MRCSQAHLLFSFPGWQRFRFVDDRRQHLRQMKRGSDASLTYVSSSRRVICDDSWQNVFFSSDFAMRSSHSPLAVHRRAERSAQLPAASATSDCSLPGRTLPQSGPTPHLLLTTISIPAVASKSETDTMTA